MVSHRSTRRPGRQQVVVEPGPSKVTSAPAPAMAAATGAAGHLGSALRRPGCRPGRHLHRQAAAGGDPAQILGTSRPWPGTHCRTALENTRSHGPSGSQAAASGQDPGRLRGSPARARSIICGELSRPASSALRPALPEHGGAVAGAAAQVQHPPGSRPGSGRTGPRRAGCARPGISCNCPGSHEGMPGSSAILSRQIDLPPFRRGGVEPRGLPVPVVGLAHPLVGPAFAS